MKKAKIFTLLFSIILSMVLVVGCGNKDDEQTPSGGETQEDTVDDGESTGDADDDLPPLKLSVMLPYGTNEHDEKELTKRFYEAIETYTNTDLEFIFYDQDMYYEKLVLTLAGNDIPSILVTGKSAEFLNAVENDGFWDVTDYIDDYENLSQMSETVRMNASINGRLYGIPRSRDLGRNGFGYRYDWLKNLGLKEPETLDDLYKMLVAFTYDDPDGNGNDDTYGLGVTEYQGTWDIMQTWFGVPNGWGLDENDDLIPAHLTAEYDEALAWFRKIYSEGLVNPDFSTVPGGDWDSALLRSGVAGSTADVVDRFRRNQEYFEGENIPAEHKIIGWIDTGHGPLTLPTDGYADLLAISKAKVKTEEELKRTLQFLNDLSDAEMLDLIEFGFEGVSYYFDEDGYAVYMTEEEMIEADVPLYVFRQGMNQLLNYFMTPENQEKRITTAPPESEIRLAEIAVKEENEKYVVPNYGASFTSETYKKNAEALDKIMADARVEYIKGEIDDVGLQEAKDQWLRSGGQTVIDEMNELYHAAE